MGEGKQAGNVEVSREWLSKVNLIISRLKYLLLALREDELPAHLDRRVAEIEELLRKL